MIHQFAASLAQSLTVPSTWWEGVYRAFFGERFHSMTAFTTDGIAQRSGIDRVVTMSTSAHYYIDEKVRSRDYGDVLLEVWSDVERQRPGWVVKELLSHYIAYAVPTADKCTMLPVVPLQAAWRRYGEEWLRRFGVREAQNPSWVTVNVPVPWLELQQAMNQMQQVDLKRRGQTAADATAHYGAREIHLPLFD